MSFRVEPVSLADFNVMRRHHHYESGDLIEPLCHILWPLPAERHSSADEDSAKRRLDFSIDWQQQRFLQDPSVHFIKAVDTKTGEIASLARWHFYPEGYKCPDFDKWEIPQYQDGGEPRGLMLDDWRGIQIFKERQRWQKAPCWVLSNLQTRHSFQRQGAGGLLVKWGTEQARKDRVPAYLEAAELAKSLYEKCGFNELEEHHGVFRQSGAEMPYTLSFMAFEP